MARIMFSGKKKFVAMAAGVVVQVLASALASYGVVIPPEIQNSITALIISYIGVEGLVDVVRAKANGTLPESRTSY